MLLVEELSAVVATNGPAEREDATDTALFEVGA
jgi:hypothetical protein